MQLLLSVAECSIQELSLNIMLVPAVSVVCILLTLRSLKYTGTLSRHTYMLDTQVELLKPQSRVLPPSVFVRSLACLHNC